MTLAKIIYHMVVPITILILQLEKNKYIQLVNFFFYFKLSNRYSKAPNIKSSSDSWIAKLWENEVQILQRNFPSTDVSLSNHTN